MVNQDTLISVIVPVYNVENFLIKCLDSIINQTLREIEIICVDDGSTDNSLNIIKKYAEKDKRVKYLTKKNSGYGNTMNEGLKLAVGKYICIVESDDYVNKTMLKKLYDVISNLNVDIVKSDYYTMTKINGKYIQTYKNVCYNQSFYNRIIDPHLEKEVFMFDMMNWTGIYNREFLMKNNIWHNETPGASYQDNGFWFQCFSFAKSIVFLNEAFYHYRLDNPNSSINSKQKVFCMCDEYDFIYEFLKKNNLNKIFVYEYYTKKFFNYLLTYNRIAEEHKLTFLQKFAEDFILAKKEIDFNKLDPWVSSMIYRIIDDPINFYYDDKLFALQKKYDEILDLKYKVDQSEEMKKGYKIKDIFKGVSNE